MNSHNLRHMYVLNYELATNRRKGVSPITRNSLASLNTHDMPPFASFWNGADIAEWQILGFLDETAAEKEITLRQDNIEMLSTFLCN